MLQNIFTGVLLGILLAIVTSLMWNIAPIVQKEALGTMERIDLGGVLGQTRALFKNRRWLAGFSLSLIGGLTYLLATQLAGIVVVQPLMNVGLIALVVLSHHRLGEEIDTRAIVGVIVLILTPVFIAFGGVTEPIMFTSYGDVLLYTAILLVLVAIMLPSTRRAAILWAPITSLLQALASQYTQWFTLSFFMGSNIVEGFINALVPLILLGVFTFLAGVYTISIGLQRNPAARFNAITGTISMFAVIFGGLYIFGQTMTSPLFYGIGLLFGVLGVILLSRYQDQEEVSAVEIEEPSNSQ
jgi:drug/metabolite transporter (DMT)-like permease